MPWYPSILEDGGCVLFDDNIVLTQGFYLYELWDVPSFPDRSMKWARLQ